jgi:CheY-like chemotaxis protein
MMAQRQALSDALTAAEEANKAKTAFLSNMSHEIRTPMNAIIGLDSIALNDPEISETTREHLTRIGASADHLLSLINDILDMSRIESGRMILKNEEFSFSKMLEAINTIFSGQAADKRIDYQCHMNSEVDDYYVGDDMKLRQVLINILGNAIKFTPEGGKVELQVERKAKFDGKTTLQFRISDTGIGMGKEFLPRLFDAFAQEDSSATSKYGSSGLGLAITKNIVEMMNGNIAVESEKDKGSVFTVTVTLSDSDRTDMGEDSSDIHPSDMTVLVVDDDTVACEHAKLVLEKAGINSEFVTSGAEAVEMVRMRHMRRNPYNLILVDWQMPEMDGVETTRQMRSIVGRESAIIILTAYNWDDILEEALQAGVDSFLPKPLFAGAVMEAFRSSMRRRSDVNRNHKAELKGRRLLLAEDVFINAEIIRMILEARGMTSDLANNGREAVEQFAAHDPGYYDAILMDMRMPEMDGLEATSTIRAMDRPDAKEIPIIALTANAFDEDVQRSLQAGLNAHLTKPIKPELLYETLEGMIRD